jgi:hypothetical protein
VGREVGADAATVHVGEAGGGKDAAPCQRHRVEVDVGGEDLQTVLIESGAETLGKQDGQRIRFLAGRATSDPDADVIARLLAAENVGDDLVQAGKSVGVAKEGGDRNQDVLAQLVEFDRRLAAVLNLEPRRDGPAPTG